MMIELKIEHNVMVQYSKVKTNHHDTNKAIHYFPKNEMVQSKNVNHF